MCKISGRVGEGHEQERYSWNLTCEDYDNGCVEADDLFTDISMLSLLELVGSSGDQQQRRSESLYFKRNIFLPNVISSMFIRDVF